LSNKPTRKTNHVMSRLLPEDLNRKEEKEREWKKVIGCKKGYEKNPRQRLPRRSQPTLEGRRFIRKGSPTTWKVSSKPKNRGKEGRKEGEQKLESTARKRKGNCQVTGLRNKESIGTNNGTKSQPPSTEKPGRGEGGGGGLEPTNFTY